MPVKIRYLLRLGVLTLKFALTNPAAPIRSLYHNHLLPWLIWLIGTSFVVFQFSFQLSFGVMAESIMHHFDMNSVDVSLLASSYYYIYVLLQTPTGWFVDRFGVRRLFVFGSLVCAAGAVCFACASLPLMLFVGRILMGGGASFAFVGSLALIRLWHPSHRFVMLVGLMETSALLMTVSSEVYFANLLLTVGWRSLMLFGASCAAIICLLSYFFIANKPTQMVLEGEQQIHFFAHVVFIVKKPIIWLNAIYCGLMATVVNVFAALWIVPFVMQQYGVTLTQASWSAAAIFVGAAVGCPIISALDMHWQSRRVVMFLSSLTTAIISFYLIFISPTSYQAVITWCFAIGFCCSSYMFPYAIACDLVPARLHNITIGFTNAVAVGMAPILQPVIGWLLDTSALHNGSVVRTVHDYHVALSVIPICAILSVGISCLLPERGE